MIKDLIVFLLNSLLLDKNLSSVPAILSGIWWLLDAGMPSINGWMRAWRAGQYMAIYGCLPNILGRHPENSKHELRSINEQLLLSTLTHWFISTFRKQITFSTGIVQNLYSPTPTMNVEEFWKVFTVSKLITALTGRNIYRMNISHF